MAAVSFLLREPGEDDEYGGLGGPMLGIETAYAPYFLERPGAIVAFMIS